MSYCVCALVLWCCHRTVVTDYLLVCFACAFKTFFLVCVKYSLFFVSVCKDPPYKVEESGYAGFILPIEVYFKNKV